MEKINISVPRLNPNDDELLVVDILITKGQKVNKGQNCAYLKPQKQLLILKANSMALLQRYSLKKINIIP